MCDALLPVLKLTTCLRPANAASFCSPPTDELLPGAQCFCFICEVPARQCQLWGSGAATLIPFAYNLYNTRAAYCDANTCFSTALPGTI